MKNQSLRTRLLSSHLALVALMSILMLGAIFNFFRLGRSIDRILKDNYKSVVAAQTMKESLERQDSAAAFFVAGQTAKARKQLAKNWSRFREAYKIEAGNITESGEQKLSVEIGRRFTIYHANIESLMNPNSVRSETQARDFYFRVLEPQFVALKTLSQEVLDLNQRAIERADERAKTEAHRASLIGIFMTIGALLLAIAFAHRAINSALTPLLLLSQGAEEIGAGHLNRRIELHRDDEIGLLANSFNSMAEKLREARRIEQHRLHRAQKMSDAALESLYDPVIVTDATSSVVHLNRAAQELFGSAEKVSGLPIAQAIDEPRIAQAIERATRQQHVSADDGEAAFVPIKIGENERTYRLRATPMRDDDDTKLGAVLVLEDITHWRELDRLKTEFIGVASHELRTPVTSLSLSAQLLQEGAGGPLTEIQREIVAAQREDLARLDALMRDLLDITRLESGVTPPRFEMISPHNLIETARDAVSAQALSKELDFQIEAPQNLPQVRADRTQIDRVLVNLLNNAIRHTPAKGHVKIAAHLQNDGVQFQIIDSGSGIPSEYLPRIFEQFVQVPGATRGGAGLGLSIAQKIIKAHGSEISVASKVGQGSVFAFALPTQKE